MKKIFRKIAVSILFILGIIFFVVLLFLAIFYTWRWWNGPELGDPFPLSVTSGYYKNRSERSIGFYWAESAYNQSKLNLKDLNYHEFKKLNHFFARDNENIYGSGVKIENVDQNTFVLIEGADCLAKDKNHVYATHYFYGPWVAKTNIADSETFVMTSETTGMDSEFEYNDIDCYTKHPFSNDLGSPRVLNEGIIRISKKTKN